MKKNLNYGFTLIEILVSITVFAILSIIVLQSIAGSLKNSAKSDSISKIRENMEFTLNTMERLLRSADRIESDPTKTNATKVTYYDRNNNVGIFACKDDSSGYGYIASGSAETRITGVDVDLDCTAHPVFQYTPNVNSADSVTISLEGTTTNNDRATVVSSSTTIKLRNY